jgi:hypothetical protein
MGISDQWLEKEVDGSGRDPMQSTKNVFQH